MVFMQKQAAAAALTPRFVIRITDCEVGWLREGSKQFTHCGLLLGAATPAACIPDGLAHTKNGPLSCF
jgi:hypothetical protein